MKIQRVTFIGVRGLRDATFDLTNPDTGVPHDLVVLTGPAASGKTRTLEAIIAAKEAIGAYGPMSPGEPWIESGVAKIVLAFHLDEEEETYAGSASAVVEAEAQFLPDRVRSDADEGIVAVLERYGHEPTRGKLEYFASTRRISALPPYHGLGANEQRALRAGKDGRKYSFVLRFLLELEHDAERARAFADRLRALSPTCRYSPGPRGADGAPRCLSSRDRPPVSPTELSDGEADAVLLAAAGTALGLSRSLVLVDRPELYADVGDAAQLVAGLRGLGQGNQLLLASASPEVVAAARGGLVLTLPGAAS
jgi:hypothetical protein